MLIAGLAILLLSFSILWGIFNRYIDRKLEPKPPVMHSIRFFGGPLDGIEETVSKVQYNYFMPHIGDGSDEQNTVNIGGMNYIEPVFAKYESVGADGDYFFLEDVSREEAMQEMMKQQEHGHGES